MKIDLNNKVMKYLVGNADLSDGCSVCRHMIINLFMATIGVIGFVVVGSLLVTGLVALISLVFVESVYVDGEWHWASSVTAHLPEYLHTFVELAMAFTLSTIVVGIVVLSLAAIASAARVITTFPKLSVIPDVAKTLMGRLCPTIELELPGSVRPLKVGKEVNIYVHGEFLSQGVIETITVDGARATFGVRRTGYDHSPYLTTTYFFNLDQFSSAELVLKENDPHWPPSECSSVAEPAPIPD